MSLPTRQIGGHKVRTGPEYCGILASVLVSLHASSTQAALNNPNVSEEAKEHSRSMIDNFEKDPDTQASRENHSENKNESRVLAGHKGTLKSKPSDSLVTVP